MKTITKPASRPPPKLIIQSLSPRPSLMDSMQGSKGGVKSDDPNFFLRRCHKAYALQKKRWQKSRGREGGRC